ncbi:MAG: NAD(P)/FAD-dependent oxidoreductase [Pseudomonadales bacterium]|jgi:cyclohexanone monooxygenase|nr:NAD(P)/FAD-dependent oxidoreductase [Pseudomonadales bacterium]
MEPINAAAIDVDALEFDPDALREKYRVERDKRLRADGNDQYVRIEGALSHYVDDPYVDEPLVRDPCSDEIDILIIGGGFGGLLTAARLREAGFEDVRIVEHAGDFGGTWYWNRYPGAACDTEAYIYLPLCEELGYVPAHKFAFQPEILEHARAIGRHYDLYRGAFFQTAVTGLEWDEAAGRWIVRTNHRDALRARFVIMSNGPLNTPKLPGIPGIEDFRGHTFHTSRWDYDYTGGGPAGGLERLHDKRVAVIGTGATAVQCVPHLGAAAQQLYVFQRTPSSIDVRANRPTDPAWVESLHAGWQRERMENFNVLTSGGIVEQDLVMDGWTEIIRNLISMANFRGSGIPREEVPRLMELADFRKMNQIRARVDAIVEDPATAEALKPWYRQFCKRPCFHDEYLPTFNRPNVRLVDTDGRGVERITEHAVVARGEAFEVDCIVFATGFEVGTAFTHRAGYDVQGAEGQKLSEKWADGMRSLHGMFVHGFPNLLLTSNSQSGFTTNFPHAMDERARHMAYVLDRCREDGSTRLEATREAEDAWVEQVIGAARTSEAFQASCTPGYYNNEGQPSRRAAQDGAYGRGPVRFFRILDAWREAGTLEGLERS